MNADPWEIRALATSLAVDCCMTMGHVHDGGPTREEGARHLTTALGRKRYWVTVGKCARCYKEFVVNGAIES